jgi:two-component system sensor histidine kinase AlgZ
MAVKNVWMGGWAGRFRWPDFRQPGVLLRLLGLAALVRVVTLLLMAPWALVDPLAWWRAGVLFEPVLASMLLLLWLTAPWWRRLAPHRALALSALLVVALALLWRAWLVARGVAGLPTGLQVAVAALAVWALAVLYIDHRQQRLSPALVEARLQALQSRMRPHFLFNSLNGVLALLRRDPARAEAMLEDLAELYRALLAEPRALVPLHEELALARAYLAVEQVRLGERLRVHWQVDTAPADAMLPPLTLQPLVENAVHHGVEPCEQGACISIEAFRDDGLLVLFVRNPLPPQPAGKRGNGLALANLRERLALHYDGQARLRAYESEGEFVAQVQLPVRAAPAVSGAPRR